MAIRTSSRGLLTFTGFLAFFVFGFTDNLKGPTIPALLGDVGLTYSQGGTIILGAYVGFLVATLLSGVLSDLAGRRVVLMTASLSLVTGLFGYSRSSQLLTLTAAMTVVGSGLGFIELGGNALIVDIHPNEKGRYLNLLTFFHGVGSIAAPLYAGRLLINQYSWRHVYLFYAPIGILLFAVLLTTREPAVATKGDRVDVHSIRRSLSQSRFLLFCVLICAYVAVEIGVAAWMVEFLQKVNGQSIGLSSLFLSLFFAGITGGRLLGSFMVDRVGYTRIMLLCSTAATVCLAAGILSGPHLAFLIPVSGLFLSIMFPTTTAAVSSFQPTNRGTAFGVLFAFGGIGGMLGPWAIGVVSDLAGLKVGFGTTIAFCAVMVGSLLVAIRRRY